MASYLKVGDPLGISVLTQEMEGVSNHFAKMATLNPPPTFVEKEAAPVLEDAHAWYATQVEQLIPAGDHILVLCKVIDLAASPEKSFNLLPGLQENNSNLKSSFFILIIFKV